VLGGQCDLNIADFAGREDRISRQAAWAGCRGGYGEIGPVRGLHEYDTFNGQWLVATVVDADDLRCTRRVESHFAKLDCALGAIDLVDVTATAAIDRAIGGQAEAV
jgi:hypothetical protein